MSRKLSFRRSRNACRRAECACRASMSCRFRRKMRFRARRGELPEEHPEKRRTSLLQRLAAVGLGRREQEHEEEPVPSPRSAPGMPLPPVERLPGRPAPRQEMRQELRQESRKSCDRIGQEPVSEYAKRAAPQGIDQHGRQAPVHNRSEEDQLDIPAFLRRQAN